MTPSLLYSQWFNVLTSTWILFIIQVESTTAVRLSHCTVSLYVTPTGMLVYLGDWDRTHVSPHLNHDTVEVPEGSTDLGRQRCVHLCTCSPMHLYTLIYVCTLTVYVHMVGMDL